MSDGTSTTSFSAGYRVFVVGVWVKDKTNFEFSYGMQDTTFWGYFPQIFFGGLVVILCLIGIFIQFIISRTTQSKLAKAVAKIKDSALVISIEMNKAKAAHVAYSEV